MNKFVRKRLNEAKNASYLQLYVTERLLRAREQRAQYKDAGTFGCQFVDGYIAAMGEMLDVIKEDDHENTKRSKTDDTQQC